MAAQFSNYTFRQTDTQKTDWRTGGQMDGRMDGLIQYFATLTGQINNYVKLV